MQYKSEHANIRRLHQKAELIRMFLDRLDESSTDSPGINQRRSVRYSYRVHGLNLEISQVGAGWIQYEVPSRNLSREGASILLGHFVYPGSVCRVHLVSLDQQRRSVMGKIVRCRYIEGSGTLHEVGIQFDNPINVDQFNPNAARLRASLINDEPGVRSLMERWFRVLDVELCCIDNPGRLFDVLKEDNCRLILIDTELSGFSALALARELRVAGYVHTLVALTDSGDKSFHEQCLAAGFTRLLGKPLTREACAELVSSLRAQPIFSSLGDDRELMELIDAFIRDLAIRMVQIETAFIDHDFDSLSRLVRTLKGEGGAYGFQSITDAADRIENAVAANDSPALIRQHLNELMNICTAVRTK